MYTTEVDAEMSAKIVLAAQDLQKSIDLCNTACSVVLFVIAAHINK